MTEPQLYSPKMEYSPQFPHLLLLFKDVPFLLLGALSLHPPEVLVVDMLWDAKGTNVQLGGRGDQVNLVDAAKRTCVDLEGTCGERWDAEH